MLQQVIERQELDGSEVHKPVASGGSFIRLCRTAFEKQIIVETAGIEPASEKQDQGLSTGLFCHGFSCPGIPRQTGKFRDQPLIPTNRNWFSPIRHGSEWVSLSEDDAL